MARSRSRSGSMSHSRSPSRSRSPVARQADVAIEDTTPFLVRIFISKGRHTPLVEFDEGNFPLRDEFQVYGWKSSTPTSLIRLLLPTFPAPYRSPLARFSFRHIYVDASQRGLYRSKDLVSFTGKELFASAKSSAEGDMDLDDRDAPLRSKSRKVEEKSLEDYGYITGDLLSVSLYVPEPKVAGPSAAPGTAGGASAGIKINGRAAAAGERERLPSGPSGAAQSFGWGDRDRTPHSGAIGRDRVDGAPAGNWGRGEPLPPQSQGSRGGRSSAPGGREPGGGGGGGGGSWRGGARGGAGGEMGIRGQARRSPDVSRRERDRSRSPDVRDRRESWGRR